MKVKKKKPVGSNEKKPKKKMKGVLSSLASLGGEMENQRGWGEKSEELTGKRGI